MKKEACFIYDIQKKYWCLYNCLAKLWEKKGTKCDGERVFFKEYQQLLVFPAAVSNIVTSANVLFDKMHIILLFSQTPHFPNDKI